MIVSDLLGVLDADTVIDVIRSCDPGIWVTETCGSLREYYPEISTASIIGISILNDTSIKRMLLWI